MSNFCKKYKLNVNNEIYTIYLKKEDNGEDSKIIIEAKNNKLFYYQIILSLYDIMRLSNAFRFCNNIYEAFNIISNAFESYNKSYLKKGNTKDELYLLLTINLPNGEEQEIKLVLNKIETVDNKYMMEEYSNNQYYQDQMDESLLNSDIINDEEELHFIENRLNQINYFKNKNIKYKLLFKGTKNGDKSWYFHTNVDGIRNTLTLVKTKKGVRFGGFTSETWNQIGGYGKTDPRAFCFSLDLKKIYNSQPDHNAIFCSDGYGPYFKGTNTIFGIYDNFFSEGGWCDYTTFTYSFGKFSKNFEITNGEQNFKVKEVEVFRVYTD